MSFHKLSFVYYYFKIYCFYLISMSPFLVKARYRCFKWLIHSLWTSVNNLFPVMWQKPELTVSRSGACIVFWHRMTGSQSVLSWNGLSNPSLFQDVDECSAPNQPCGEGHVCINSPGSYRCECRLGYYFDGISRSCTGKWLFFSLFFHPTTTFCFYYKDNVSWTNSLIAHWFLYGLVSLFK